MGPWVLFFFCCPNVLKNEEKEYRKGEASRDYELVYKISLVCSRESRLYKRVCPSVRRSVGPSVRWSVGRSVGRSVRNRNAFFLSY